jgi:hypothetical protein
MNAFVAGLLVMGYAVCALFFARFWNETRDRLFLFFTAAFALLALQRALLATVLLPLDPSWYFLIRLAAYVLILAAIVDKNARA